MYRRCAASELACIWTTTDRSVLHSLLMTFLFDAPPIRCRKFEGRGGMEATLVTNPELDFRGHRYTSILLSKSYRKSSMLRARSKGPNKETALR